MYYISVEYIVINHTMPYAYKKKLLKKSRRKTRKPVKRYKSLPALVKREIQKAAEVKRINADPVSYTFGVNNLTMSPAVDLNAYFLSIGEGTGDGERIGEEIMTKSAKMKMVIQSPTNDAAILQLFIGTYKATPGSLPTAGQLGQIFDDGAGTASADGTLLSLLRSVNTDVWRIYNYKQLKIGRQNLSGSVQNNDFPLYRKLTIDLTKHLGKLKFPSGAAGPPTNKHLYIFCNWVNPLTGTSSTDPPKVQYYMDYTYTDL